MCIRDRRDSKGKKLKRFTRDETFGYPTMGWAHVVVDTEADKLFSVETHPWSEKSR